MDARGAALEFIEAINRQDVEGPLALVTKDHVFIGTWNNRQGRAEMAEGWTGYFGWFPDYRIEVSEMLADGDTVAVFNFASGTYLGRKAEGGENHWKLPAVWRVVAQDGKVKVCQVFADAKIPFDIMDEANKEKVERLK